jgi:N-acetylneuraminate synthase/N,N'-diacetyllegionaminate synthase
MSASPRSAALRLDDVIGTATYVIAEAGVNHNGSVEQARRLIDVAAEAGADAVKFQTFRASTLVSAATPMADYQQRNTGTSTSMEAMLRALELSFNDFAALAEYCRQVGIEFLSTPFDVESADFLHHLGMRAFKLASGEITNPQLIRHIGSFGRPVILSTGMADLGEIERAIGWLEDSGTSDIAILHCVSDYPTAPADVNLRAMDTIAAAFGYPVGWSDHCLGDTVSIAAVARGARIIEKHFTLDKSLPGPDHKASLEPGELAQMVERIHVVQQALGSGRKGPTMAERNVKAVARRSIAALCDIAAGERITRAQLGFLRPGTGLAPELVEMVVGRTARTTIPGGTLLTLAQIG